jgi:hypothetical protein
VTEGPTVKVMKLRYAGNCGCGRHAPAGTRAGYDPISRTVVCENCLAGRAVGTPPPTGSSLERTYDKRKADREERVTTRFPRAGRFLLAITPEPASTRAFKTGAEGEAKAVERILGRAGDHAGFLRNRTGWLESLDKQRDAVRLSLADSADFGDVPVLLAFCFVDADLRCWNACPSGTCPSTDPGSSVAGCARSPVRTTRPIVPRSFGCSPKAFRRPECQHAQAAPATDRTSSPGATCVSGPTRRKPRTRCAAT